MRKSRIKDWVVENYGETRDGEEVSCRGNCPCFRRDVLDFPKDWDCGLGVRKCGGVLQYNCFKPSCPVKGGNIHMSALDRLRAAKGPVTSSNEDTGTTADRVAVVLPEDYVPYVQGSGEEWLCERLGVTHYEITSNRIGQLAGSGQIVIPVYGLGGDLEWFQRRRYFYNEGHGPKWMSPKGGESPIYIPRPIKKGVWGVLTEDALSAIRVARVYPSCALMGTVVSDYKLSKLLEWKRLVGVTSLVICLDSDAYNKAVGIAEHLRNYFNSVVVFNHKLNDPKYWDEDYIERVVHAARENHKSTIDEGSLR